MHSLFSFLYLKLHFISLFLCSLRAVLADHMNAEIVAGTITSKQDAMDYVTWTYFFRRLLMNPSYYQLEESTKDSINTFLSHLVSGALAELETSYCIEFEEVSMEEFNFIQIKLKIVMQNPSVSHHKIVYVPLLLISSVTANVVTETKYTVCILCVP